MSYILDALKKAEQIRSQGKAPTLFDVQATAQQTARKRIWPWIAIVAITINGALLFYLLQRDWSSRRPAKTAPSSLQAQPTSPAPVSSTQDNRAPTPTIPTIADAAPKPLPPVNAPPVNVPAKKEVVKNVTASPVRLTPTTTITSTPLTPSAPKPAPIQNTANQPPRLMELPLAIQTEIPKLAVAMHMYSDKPSRRLVSVNNKPLREGDELSPGLRLLEIKPDGLIFSYRGHQFKQGIN
jgi:hypothetical protein